MKPYIVAVAGILHDLGADVVLDGDVEIPDFQAGDTLFRAAGPGHLSATVVNGGDAVVLHGSIHVDLTTECVRCLEPFPLPLDVPLEGLYTTPDKAEELPEDQEWYLLGHETIDIAPAIESAIRLELPFAPLHSEDCAGICPVCGCNRNLDACSCADEQDEPGPFDALKGLLTDEDAT